MDIICEKEINTLKIYFQQNTQTCVKPKKGKEVLQEKKKVI